MIVNNINPLARKKLIDIVTEYEVFTCLKWLWTTLIHLREKKIDIVTEYEVFTYLPVENNFAYSFLYRT